MHNLQYFKKQIQKTQSILIFYLNVCLKSKYKLFQNRVISSSKELIQSCNQHLYN